MMYWKINNELIKGWTFSTALHKFGQSYEFGVGAEFDISITRLSKKQYEKLGGK